MNPEKITILANAASRTLNHKALESAVAIVSRQVACEVIFTTSMQHAQEISAQLSANPANLIAACGGDGTIHTLLNSCHPGSPMGVIPAGTANVIARELGIPLNMQDACKTLLTGALQNIDAGLCNDRKFLFVAGIGFDARVAASVSPLLKRLIGRYAYHIAGLKEFLGYIPPRLTVTTSASSQTWQGKFAIIANMRRYGGDLFFAPEARHDDQILDMVLLKQFNITSLLKLLNFAKRNGPFPFDAAEIIRSRDFEIISDTPVPYQLDGEVFAATSTFHIAIDAVRARIITP